MITAIKAVGLGSIEVVSKFNQPLRAQIPLLSLGNTPLEQVTAKLASDKEFAEVKLDKPEKLLNLKFKLDRNEKGAPLVIVTTTHPIHDPFLTFLIKVSWPDGSLLKEYMILLDPVDDSNQKAAISLPSKNKLQSELASQASINVYGPTQAQESLWSIATKLRPNNGVTMQQVMLALVKVNPNSFVDSNVNGLKQGSMLNIPSVAEMAAVLPAQAAAEIQQQNNTWHPHHKVVKLEHIYKSSVLSQAKAPSKEGEALGKIEIKQLPESLPHSLTAASVKAEHTLQVAALLEQMAAISKKIDELGHSREEISAEIEKIDFRYQAMQAKLKVQAERLDNLQSFMMKTEPQPSQLAESALSHSLSGGDSPANNFIPESGTKNNLNLLTAFLLLLTVVGGYFFWKYKKAQQEAIRQEADIKFSEYRKRIQTRARNIDSSRVKEEGTHQDAGNRTLTEEYNDHYELFEKIDIYLKYKRYNHAQNVLENAIHEHPEQISLKIKLLEVYALCKEFEAFETLFRQLPKGWKQVYPGVKDKIASLRNQLNAKSLPGAAPNDIYSGAEMESLKGNIKYSANGHKGLETPNAKSSTLNSTTTSDPIITKLNLAKTYIEMRNFSHAKQLLTEVLQFGSETQRARAQELVEYIGDQA